MNPKRGIFQQCAIKHDRLGANCDYIESRASTESESIHPGDDDQRNERLNKNKG